MNELEKTLINEPSIESIGFKTVLYTQGETPLDKDKIIVDGMLYPFDSTNQMLYDSQSLLLDKTNMKEVNLISDDLKCFYKKDKGIFFQGLYNTTVKSGSRNYYMYYADTDDIDKAISQFKLLSERILHYEWAEDGLELISKAYKKKGRVKHFGVISVVSLIIVLALTLLLNNRSETIINPDIKDTIRINSKCEINNNTTVP